jgi:hypothetical protein
MIPSFAFIPSLSSLLTSIPSAIIIRRMMTILIISRLIESLILSFSLFDLLHLLSLLLFLLSVKFFDFHRAGSLSSQRLLPARLSIFKHILDETLDLVGSLGERWIFGSHKISKARKDRIDFVCLD